MKYCTVILGKDFVHLSSFIPQILDFLNILLNGLHFYFWWRDSENREHMENNGRTKTRWNSAETVKDARNNQE